MTTLRHAYYGLMYHPSHRSLRNCGWHLAPITKMKNGTRKRLSVHNGPLTHRLPDGLPILTQKQKVWALRHGQNTASLSTGRPPEPDGSSADGTIRQIQVDTGCTRTLGFTDHDGRLTKRQKANVIISTAAIGFSLHASYSGVLSVDVMNSNNDPTLPGSIPFQTDILTVPNLCEELMSVDSFYAQQGYEVFLTHPTKGGHPHMRKGNRKIPFR